MVSNEDGLVVTLRNLFAKGTHHRRRAQSLEHILSRRLSNFDGQRIDRHGAADDAVSRKGQNAPGETAHDGQGNASDGGP